MNITKFQTSIDQQIMWLKCVNYLTRSGSQEDRDNLQQLAALLHGLGESLLPEVYPIIHAIDELNTSNEKYDPAQLSQLALKIIERLSTLKKN
jgi:hypothetical protein